MKKNRFWALILCLIIVTFIFIVIKGKLSFKKASFNETDEVDVEINETSEKENVGKDSLFETSITTSNYDCTDDSKEKEITDAEARAEEYRANYTDGKGNLAGDPYTSDDIVEQAKIDTYEMNYQGSLFVNLSDLYEDMEGDEYLDPGKFNSALFAQAAAMYFDDINGLEYVYGEDEPRYMLTYCDDTFTSNMNFCYWVFTVDTFPGQHFRGYYNCISNGYFIAEAGRYDPY